MMRQEIIELIEHGPLPPSKGADVNWLKRHEELMKRVTRPVTDDEACALAKLFGPDDCFGVAWSLVHLIETAPGWPLPSCLPDSNNEWIRVLRSRADRGRKRSTD
jgi:hypothetical protein